MITCGIDGLSRSTKNQGVLAGHGKGLVDILPLRLSVVERSENFW